MRLPACELPGRGPSAPGGMSRKCGESSTLAAIGRPCAWFISSAQLAFLTKEVYLHGICARKTPCDAFAKFAKNSLNFPYSPHSISRSSSNWCTR